MLLVKYYIRYKWFAVLDSSTHSGFYMTCFGKYCGGREERSVAHAGSGHYCQVTISHACGLVIHYVAWQVHSFLCHHLFFFLFVGVIIAVSYTHLFS